MPQNKENFLIILICSFCIYAYLSINMVLPALPQLSYVFHTTHAKIKFSVTMLLLGYSVAQMFWGILSDRFGRRKIVLLAMLITIIGSLVSAFANSILIFSIARLIEGFGSGFGPALARIIAKDSLDDKKMHIALTYLVSIVALMPAIAPVIGGQILHWLDWRAILFVLALFGICIYLVTYFSFTETLTHPLTKLSIQHIAKDTWKTFTNKTYMGYLLAYSFALGGLIVFYIMAPYLFISHLHISSTYYGAILFFVGFAYMVGATINRKLINHVASIHRLIWLGYAFILLTIITLIVFTSLAFFNVFAIVIPACLFGIACGFISPTVNSAAMSHIRGNAGIPVALLGCTVMLISTITTAILANFSYGNLLTLLLMFSSVSLCSLLSYIILVPRKKDYFEK